MFFCWLPVRDVFRTFCFEINGEELKKTADFNFLIQTIGHKK
jgi:hypothetical protein